MLLNDSRTRKQIVSQTGMNITRIKLGFVILALTMPALGFQAARAEDSVGGTQEVELRVRIVYQLTDVVVRDKDGEFIRDLDAGDFILEVDGKPKDLKFVEEADGPRNVVVIIDRFNLGDEALEDAKARAKLIVEEVLEQNGWIAVLQYNGFLQTLCGWTDDKEAILDAIDRAGGQILNSYYLPNFRQVRHQWSNPQLFGKYIISFSALASALQTTQGRKTCILFSEGFNTFSVTDKITPGGAIPVVSWYYRNSQRLTGYRHYVDTLGQTRTSSKLNEAAVENLKGLSMQFDSANTSFCVIRTGSEEPEWKTISETRFRPMAANPVYSREKIAHWLKLTEENRLALLKFLVEINNGFYQEAPIDSQVLIDDLHKVTSEYYILGFDTTGDSETDYHKISVKTRNPELIITHRKGYFRERKFHSLTSEERAAHLEEGFLAPGIRNDLHLKARAYEIPLTSDRTALLGFSIDSTIPLAAADGTRELEILITLKDSEEQDRYRIHKILKSREVISQPRLRLGYEVPLLRERCVIYLAVRDNNSGWRSSWNEVFEAVNIDIGISCSEPILLKSENGGDLSSWDSTEISDEGKVHDPPSPIGVTIAGEPLPTNEIHQNEEVNSLIFVNGLGEHFNPAESAITVHYVLDPQAEESYILSTIDQKISYSASQGLLIIRARLPLGLAQKERGELSILITGLPNEVRAIASTTYRIVGFDSDEAKKKLEEDGRIRLLK